MEENKIKQSDYFEVLRAEEEWQRAGAYSVRIQGMNPQHHISLRDEFDEHDGSVVQSGVFRCIQMKKHLSVV